MLIACISLQALQLPIEVNEVHAQEGKLGICNERATAAAHSSMQFVAEYKLATPFVLFRSCSKPVYEDNNTLMLRTSTSNFCTRFYALKVTIEHP
jgi:hypothetical protein